MNYFFRYLIQYSGFFNDTLKKRSKIYFNASYLYNYQSSCYNLISKKKFYYFIDPETFKFQYGGNRAFYLNYIEYFRDLDGLIDPNNKISLDYLSNSNNFNDFFKKVIRFQRTMLASTHIPLDFYKAIAEGTSKLLRYNPTEQLLFIISPYFEFNDIHDSSYNYNKKFSEKESDFYTLLRFPKEILSNSDNIKKIYNDFKNQKGILLNIIELDQYNINDLNQYFGNLIDLIYQFAQNNQYVILMNNSEFGKYLQYFGLKDVCSNVMIGQRSYYYEPTRDTNRKANTDFSYIPLIERSVSFTSSNSLIKRCKELKKMYPKGVLDLNLDSRINKYYEFLEEKINKINSSNLDIIVNEIERNFDKINHELHRRKYKYILKWKEVLLNKYKQYAN